MKSITYYHKGIALSRTFLELGRTDDVGKYLIRCGSFGLRVGLPRLDENQQERVRHSPLLETLRETFRGKDLRQEPGLCDQCSEGSWNRRLGAIEFPTFTFVVLPRPV
jgi:hypothetical protein